MSEPSQRTRADHPPDVAALRTERPDDWFVGHFCGVCGCSKSGWPDVPNIVAEWCEDAGCPCHDDERGPDGPGMIDDLSQIARRWREARAQRLDAPEGSPASRALTRKMVQLSKAYGRAVDAHHARR